MSEEIERLRQILAAAKGANDNGNKPAKPVSGENVTYHFHGPVTFNLFSGPQARPQPSQQAAPTAKISPLVGQAPRSPASIRRALEALPPYRA